MSGAFEGESEMKVMNIRNILIIFCLYSLVLSGLLSFTDDVMAAGTLTYCQGPLMNYNTSYGNDQFDCKYSDTNTYNYYCEETASELAYCRSFASPSSDYYDCGSSVNNMIATSTGFLFVNCSLVYTQLSILDRGFTDNGNGTVTDNDTGLIWQKAEGGSMTWDSAITYCESLSLTGNNDWRLPDIKELESIADDSKSNPSINTTYFPTANPSYYWSSTTSVYSPTSAWGVYFYDGNVGFYEKLGSNHVRCVRGGQ